MTRKICIVLLVSLVGAGPAWCQQPGEPIDKYRYLIDATNKIYDLTQRSVEPEPKERAEIAARACNALKELLGDMDFIADLQRMAKATPEHKEQHTRMRRDLVSFLDAFLKPEAGLLSKAGLSGAAVFEVSSAASFLSGQALGQQPDPDKILAAIGTLRKDICAAAVTLAQAQKDELGNIERNRRWKKLALGMGGVVVIIVDAKSAVPTGGLATASFVIGGAMLTEGISD